MKINQKILLVFFIILLLLIGSFLIFFKLDSIFEFIEKSIILFSVVFGSFFLISLALIILLSIHITNPLKRITSVIQTINKEETETIKSKLPVRKDEIGEVADSADKLNTTFRVTSNFAYLLVRGKYDVDQQIDDNNYLGNVLYELKEKLQLSEKEKKYVQEENRKTEWYQQGISNFTKLLQQNFKDTVEMANSAVRELIKHTEVEQGGIFILEKRDDTEVLVLDSAYAYDKKKLLNSEIEIGESLVGKCAKERKIIQIDDLPEGYTFIGSGLGEDTPRSLLLLPMIYENNLFGVIEIASLKKVPEYKLNFLKTISERIASEISNIQSKLLTEKLAEDFKKQAEEISEKEKASEKRINELNEKIEFLKNKNLEKESLATGNDAYMSIVEIDKNANIIQYNDAALYQYTNEYKDEISIDTVIFRNVPDEEKNFRQFWETLKSERNLIKTTQISNKDKTKLLRQIFLHMQEDKTEKLICIASEMNE